MSTVKRKYKVELPEEIRNTVGVSFKASPRTMEKAAAYATRHEMTLSETCRLALEKLVESTPLASK